MDDKPTYDELAAQLRDALERERGLREGYARIAESLGINEHRAKWFVLEINELKAHVERLRGALDNMIKAFMPPEGSGAGSRGVDDVTVASCVVLIETPAQSLNHIMAQTAKRQCSELAAQVEEETIERCVNCINSADVPEWAVVEIGMMPRKYSNQTETTEKDGE